MCLKAEHRMEPVHEDTASCIQMHYFLSHITPVHVRMAENRKTVAAIECQLPAVRKGPNPVPSCHLTTAIR